MKRYLSLYTAKKNNIEIFTTYCANKNTIFLLNIRDEENERGQNNHLLQTKFVDRIDQNMGRNDQKVSN